MELIGTDEQKIALLTSLNQFHKRGVGFEQTINPFYKSSYVKLDDIIPVLQKELSALDLIPILEVTNTYVKLTLYHLGGGYLKFEPYNIDFPIPDLPQYAFQALTASEAKDLWKTKNNLQSIDSQMLAARITFGIRQLLGGALFLRRCDNDDDGNSEVANRLPFSNQEEAIAWGVETTGMTQDAVEKLLEAVPADASGKKSVNFYLKVKKMTSKKG